MAHAIDDHAHHRALATASGDFGDAVAMTASKTVILIRLQRKMMRLMFLTQAAALDCHWLHRHCHGFS